MKVTCSKKIIVQHLLESCYKYGVRNVVISPGSRNAPLTISFSQNPLFNCYSIPDERSAAFYALGMAKQLNEPVVILCTSGTAVLNYAPALAEAYYQEISLIAITADRPPEWIDQEDGQTIRQPNIYTNFIRCSVSLPIIETDESLKIVNNDIENAFQKALGNTKGPIHINVPFNEPLYETEEINFCKLNWQSNIEKEYNSQFEELIQAWNQFDKILIIAGVLPVNADLEKLLGELIENKNVVVVASATSNLRNEKIIGIPELLFNTISNDLKKQLQPDLLISIGGSVISKATKLFLRSYKPKQHFDIDFNKVRIDTYSSLTNKIISSHSKALSYVNNNTNEKPKIYLDTFLDLQTEKLDSVKIIHQKMSFSDMRFYSLFMESINEKIDLHLANSTPVRYAELFLKHPKINYFCNRGTSGIDGNTSITAGSAIATNNKTILITGDISFGYDSNAFWNNHVPENLKVIVVNNGGGNIFKIISGPSTSNSLEYFETPIKKSTEQFCSTYSISYLSASSEKELTLEIDNLLESKTCTVLEVFTSPDESAENYKRLFRQLRKPSVENL